MKLIPKKPTAGSSRLLSFAGMADEVALIQQYGQGDRDRRRINFGPEQPRMWRKTRALNDSLDPPLGQWITYAQETLARMNF